MAKRKKQEYKGSVISAFRISGVSYKVGDAYETEIKDRFKFLINNNKIK